MRHQESDVTSLFMGNVGRFDQRDSDSFLLPRFAELGFRPHRPKFVASKRVAAPKDRSAILNLLDRIGRRRSLALLIRSFVRLVRNCKEATPDHSQHTFAFA